MVTAAVGDGSPRPASPWVLRWACLVPVGGRVLDVACGAGRNTRLFLGLGHPVLALDRDLSGIDDLGPHPGLEALAVDLEDGQADPFGGRRFDGVVITNYLHRPLLGSLVRAVADGGVLVYETFARGQERFGRPTNPAFLLRPGELLEASRGALRVVAYEDLVVAEPRPAAIQRIVAVREH